MIEDYAELKQAVESAGYFTTFQPIDNPGDRIVLASHRHSSGFGLGGNSFSVALRQKQWYVVTWAPVICRIDSFEKLVTLSLHLLSREPAKAYGDFDESIRIAFGLIEVSDDEFLRLPSE